MGKSLIIKGADFSANGILPEFVQLKSIIATAETQFIVSPVLFTKTSRIVAEIGVHSLSNGGSMFGFRDTRGNFAEQMIYVARDKTNARLFAYINNKNLLAVNISYNDTNKHTIDMSRYSVKMDNLTPVTPASPTYDGDVTVGIFGLWDVYTTPGVGVGVELYSIKMYSNYQDDTSLVLDCIPVKRNSDNKICLYDKISGEYLFTNDGTNPDYELQD